MTQVQVSTEVIQREPLDAVRVVVGFDGSAGATAALRWAYDEATLRKAQLQVIHAVGSFGSYPSLAVSVGDVHRQAAELLEKAVHEVAGEDQVDEIERLLFDGSAAKVLVSAVADNDLLVARVSRARRLRRPSARLGQPTVPCSTLPAPSLLSLMSPGRERT